ncbi:hypothetical protein GCM10008967_02580 [Bacillus carboniphilus]|uniref:Group-specific protein n=1 Tax=Bacillus carboniphilus TaxID=86663 RepID=A0ABP3FH46_9BACI
MEIAIILVVVIMIAGIIGTLILAGKSDEHYSKATKGNVTRLTLIYVILAIILVIGLGLYIYFN